MTTKYKPKRYKIKYISTVQGEKATDSALYPNAYPLKMAQRICAKYPNFKYEAI